MVEVAGVAVGLPLLPLLGAAPPWGAAGVPGEVPEGVPAALLALMPPVAGE